MKARGRPYP